MQLEEILAGEGAAADGTFTTNVTEDWLQGRSVFGGLQGTLALVAEEESVRADALRKGEELLDNGSVSHNHLYFYRDAMEVSASHQRWRDVERYAGRLQAYTRGQPLPWADLLIARGQALARFGRDSQDAAARNELLRVRAEALRVGFYRARLPPDVDAALAD